MSKAPYCKLCSNAHWGLSHVVDKVAKKRAIRLAPKASVGDESQEEAVQAGVQAVQGQGPVVFTLGPNDTFLRISMPPIATSPNGDHLTVEASPNTSPNARWREKNPEAYRAYMKAYMQKRRG